MTTIFGVWVHIISFMLQKEQFQFHHRLIMGEVTWLTVDLTSVDMHEKSEVNKMWAPEGLLLSESFTFLRKIANHWQRCEVAPFCDREEAYLWRHRSVNWPALEMKNLIMSDLNCGSILSNLISIANSPGAIARKPGGTWHQPLGRRGSASQPLKKGRYSPKKVFNNNFWAACICVTPNACAMCKTKKWQFDKNYNNCD